VSNGSLHVLHHETQAPVWTTEVGPNTSEQMWGRPGPIGRPV
jgi:hypothetical protein